MWAAWTSSSMTTPTSSAGAAESTPSVAAALASSPSPVASQIPQWRLLTAVSQRVAQKWPRTLPQLTRLTVAVAAVAALVGTVVFARGAHQRCRRRRLPTSTGEDEEDVPHASSHTGAGASADTSKQQDDSDADAIQFADPAESAFNAYVQRLRRQKEPVLLSAIAQLESAAAELKAAQHAAEHPNAEGDQNEMEREGGDGDDGVAQVAAKVHRAAVVADELLTQWICSLDGVPVRQSKHLKQRRKELVQRAALLSQRIAPYLHPAASATLREVT
ncbi:hypothetical protein ABB37_06390 [Leptomonas pyrrhocoris]|uniref:BAG domain-containing protein n=1 Tax=Leptomonas pyrrhocoris TaxID=157538 RepID=A0A0N0DU13_LEPPY|nr:hypothetical protein ABB37_06390 [Leptomonas pyrrhocoris]XP_015656673.1 hypothetical protein ABB37_06390 [Leptomonas pyrrhocoris]KPA78233.1 hypothetical protein ABB37_06390 [Leptomonas pyrrhocoris]KPA78234.1 hypothetical protein ABB37_06390 [Leptomonas pyrrhocoris]|eukprot:XP_015656672.1 hypothetical protein ABB37_06390 [Leptomonas pyrrhocoris]